MSATRAPNMSGAWYDCYRLNTKHAYARMLASKYRPAMQSAHNAQDKKEGVILFEMGNFGMLIERAQLLAQSSTAGGFFDGQDTYGNRECTAFRKMQQLSLPSADRLKDADCSQRWQNPCFAPPCTHPPDAIDNGNP